MTQSLQETKKAILAGVDTVLSPLSDPDHTHIEVRIVREEVARYLEAALDRYGETAKTDTTQVSRVEVIDHSKPKDSPDYGRVYNFWHQYRASDHPNPIVTLDLQDKGRTLKVFIS